MLFNTSTRSTRCKVVSGSSLNTLTLVIAVLVSFSLVWQPNLLQLMFHSLELLSISTFSHRFRLGFCPAASCTFVIAFLGVTRTQLSHAAVKKDCVPYTHIHTHTHIYIYIYKLDARLDSLAFPVTRD